LYTRPSTQVQTNAYREVYNEYVVGIRARVINLSKKIWTDNPTTTTTTVTGQKRSKSHVKFIAPRREFTTFFCDGDATSRQTKDLARTAPRITKPHEISTPSASLSLYCYYYDGRTRHLFVLSNSRRIAKMFFVISISNGPRQRGQRYEYKRKRANTICKNHNGRLLNISAIANGFVQVTWNMRNVAAVVW